MNPLRSLASLIRQSLTSKSKRPCRGRRFVTLRLEQLEERDCPAVNLIANASVESLGPNPNEPLAWHVGNWGTNTPSFAVTAGLEGQRALRIDMTSRSSGDAKWFFDDVSVSPGATYTFADLYTANVATSATIRFLMSDGSYSYVGNYSAPAAATPTRFSFDFTAPAGAVSATVFHLIAAPGFLVADAFELTQAGSSQPPPPAPTPGNLIVNPSVESVGANGDPVNWFKNNWGSNTAVFASAPGLAGGNAVRVDVTNYASGDAKWYFSDVSVTPAAQYTFSDLYTSNVITSATIRYTLNNGSSEYVGVATAPAASTPTRLAFDFTAPANAVSATVFHLISTNGYLVTDAFELRAAGGTTDTVAPTVSMTGPSANAAVSGTINLTAQASDNVGVAGVRFLVDGTAVGAEDTSSPYQVTLDTTPLSEGNHTVAAVARDAAGNSSTSGSVTFNVSTTLPPPAPTPTNLIQNPSAETLGANGNPSNWLTSTWGSHTAAFSVLTPGADGTRALRVQVSNYASGDAKWYFGDVAVTPNTTYAFSDWYRSSRESKLVVRYQLTDGSNSYVYVGALGAAANWTKASYQLTTPVNVASMTVFHLLEGNGWLETDNFALTGGTSTAPGDTFARGMVSLTFDDGWLSQLQNAVPILQQANMPASFFIITRANTGGAEWEEVLNPSLESAGSNGQPLDWLQSRTGVNSAAFSYPSTGVDGVKAARIDVQSHSSGDASWYFQDVHVVAGSQYTISHHYNANAPTSVLVRFTRHNGSFSFVDLGTLAATNGQWRTHSATVTAPANADAMTVFHRIAGVGSLIVDDYSVRPTDLFANASYMNPAQIQSLQAAGFEVGAHSLTHADLLSLSDAGALAEIDGSRADLLALGITPTSFVYPYGAYDAPLQQQVAANGFVGARSVNAGFNTPTTDRFALLHQEVHRDTTLAEVQSWINTAAQTKTWLILTFHPIDYSGDFYGTTPEFLQQVVNLVAAANLDVVTMRDGVARMA